MAECPAAGRGYALSCSWLYFWSSIYPLSDFQICTDTPRPLRLGAAIYLYAGARLASNQLSGDVDANGYIDSVARYGRPENAQQPASTHDRSSRSSPSPSQTEPEEFQKIGGVRPGLQSLGLCCLSGFKFNPGICSTAFITREGSGRLLHAPSNGFTVLSGVPHGPPLFAPSCIDTDAMADGRFSGFLDMAQFAPPAHFSVGVTHALRRAVVRSSVSLRRSFAFRNLYV